MGIPIYNMSDKGNIFCKNNDMIQFGESMIRFIPMKVVTIQAIYESNQSNQNEGWYESKNNDTIQQGKTQDQRVNLIRFNILWIYSGIIESRSNESNQISTNNKSQD